MGRPNGAWRNRWQANDSVAPPPATPADWNRWQANDSPTAHFTPLRWIALAFVPSTLLVGATTFLGSDIAAVPLLWVPPLALYLLSFILVFAFPPRGPRTLLVAAFVALAVLLFAFSLPRTMQTLAAIPVHFLLVFLAGLVFHGELARTRPPSAQLTGFYLSMSLGGALGGVFASLVAPLLFRGVYEYPLAMAFGLLLLPPPTPRPTEAEREAALLQSLGIAAPSPAPAPPRRPRLALLDVAVPVLACAATAILSRAEAPSFLAVGAPLFVAIFLSVRSRRRLGAAMLGITVAASLGGRALHQERTFFGVLRVEDDGELRTFLHGTTIHGQEWLAPERQREPVLYYAREGPVGQMFAALASRLASSEIAIVGLGAGGLAAYAEPGQTWTFYEIDDAVERIARRYFHYLADSPAKTDVVLGDARLMLKHAPEHGYALLFLDAFSSDAVPTHLLTREAFALYESKLGAHGVIVGNISNRYVRLESVLAGIAADRGLVARLGRSAEVGHGTWVVFARREEDSARSLQTRRGGRSAWRRRRGPMTSRTSPPASSSSDAHCGCTGAANCVRMGMVLSVVQKPETPKKTMCRKNGGVGVCPLKVA